jgi:hypothetical protein
MRAAFQDKIPDLSVTRAEKDLLEILEEHGVYLMKDLKIFFKEGVMIHDSAVGNGFYYKRFNYSLKRMEFLGYTG